MRAMSAALARGTTDPDPIDYAAALRARIAAREAEIAVIGLGHVGLPLARAIARAGFRTLGYDIDAVRLGRIATGDAGISTLPAIELRALTAGGRLRTSADAADLAGAEVLIVCVPTPLAPDRSPDLAHVEAAMRDVARRLRPGALVVLESTTWPGSTRDVVRPILEAGGLRCGVDLFLAYSPEREDPGNPRYDTAAIPKLVAGIDAASGALAVAFYQAVVDRVVPVESVEVAEAAKLTENVFRAVNIGLVNELKLVFAALGLDVWQVLEAAASKPFGFLPFWPGPGVGGHCIPVDPLYLTWAARRHGVPARLVELAASINEAMPAHVVGRLGAALAARGQALAGARVLVLGVGYKRNQDDCRDSPGVAVMAALEAAGAVAAFHDPLVAVLPAGSVLAGRRGIAWSTPALRGFDAAVIATDHTRVDYAALAAAVPLVVDTRNVCARLGVSGPGIIQA